jgi:hypothetical protein
MADCETEQNTLGNCPHPVSENQKGTNSELSEERLPMDCTLVVFDIDDTITRKIPFYETEQVETAEIKLQCTYEDDETNEKTTEIDGYKLMNGVLELLRFLVLEKKLRIAFFSSGRDKQNSEIGVS